MAITIIFAIYLAVAIALFVANWNNIERDARSVIQAVFACLLWPVGVVVLVVGIATMLIDSDE